MRKTQLSVVMDADRLDTVDIIAKYHETSRSATIDELVRRGLKRLTTLELQALETEHLKRKRG